MTKFERLKQRLKKEWGEHLIKGHKDFDYGYKTGYIVIGRNYGSYDVRYTTLKEIEEQLERDM